MMKYLPHMNIPAVNRKGVLDVDTVKGCSFGTKTYPGGGCYGLCYAFRMAKARGFDFTKSVSRIPREQDKSKIESAVKAHKLSWFRIGVMGDPCHDWPLTISICEWLGKFKIPVIVTKHWLPIQNEFLPILLRIGAIINTSISPLDSDGEISYRLGEFKRLGNSGIKSVLRIVSAQFGFNERGRKLAEIQNILFRESPIIDTPLRIPRNDMRVKRFDILLRKQGVISKFNPDTYVGTCPACPDQCGVNFFNPGRDRNEASTVV